MTIHYTAKPYQVISVMSPSKDLAEILVYGVQNATTGVVEAYIGELPKAMKMADALVYDLAHHDASEYSRQAAEFERGGGLAGIIRGLKSDPDDGPGFTFNG